ncbi:hypothetical protein Nepgr_010119 [Nepenthes gracilis]|uniref:Uncharacterized protein n=1 Tax=Nepenthes gracilis TaxID=150966 RepID=A0AAD3XL06_NEPGR|nr:hypothetical protein Nepgr_010119 [Nepenthes gracilis]
MFLTDPIILLNLCSAPDPPLFISKFLAAVTFLHFIFCSRHINLFLTKSFAREVVLFNFFSPLHLLTKSAATIKNFSQIDRVALQTYIPGPPAN